MEKGGIVDDAAARARRPGASAGGLRLGLSSGALFPRPTEATPDIAAAEGLADLELLLQTVGEYEAGFLRAVRTRADGAGCRVQAVHLWQAFHPLLDRYRRRVEEGRGLFDRAIAGAVEVGAGVLVWHGAKRGEVATAEDRERFLAVAAERAAACAAAGVELAVENVSWCVLGDVREVAAFAARLPGLGEAGRHLGFAFDPFQAAEAGANPFMLLAAMGDRVRDVHLSDRREDDPAARHLPPGEGDLPWPALVRAIAGAYAGPMMLEGIVGDDLGRLAASRAFLEPLLVAVRGGEDAPDDCSGAPPPGVWEGIRLFNARRFYECHETIEHEWHAERRPIRRLYQGILQIGVGFHHALGGNHRGALALLGDGIAKTEAFAPRCLGIETGRLALESRVCLDRLRELGPARIGDFDPATIPLVHLSSDGDPVPGPAVPSGG